MQCGLYGALHLVVLAHLYRRLLGRMHAELQRGLCRRLRCGLRDGLRR